MKTHELVDQPSRRTNQVPIRRHGLKTLVRLVIPASLRMMIWEARQRPWRALAAQWGYDLLPDRYVQQQQFMQAHGRRINFPNPTTFNEKLHWLIRYDRRPILTQLADKYAVRDYVTDRGCAGLLNDLYGVWDDPEAISFEQLPDAFVLKVTHGSGQNLFCLDKSRLNVAATRCQLAAWMHRSEYWTSREWAYKHIPPRVICERLLTDKLGAVPADFKFFCFDGEPHMIQVDTDRFTKHHRDLFDPTWTRFPTSLGFPTSRHPVTRPVMLEAMLDAARRLSQGFAFVRVDLYAIETRVFFGELTWYPGGGLERFNPDQYDVELGQVLALPTRAFCRGRP